MLRTRSGFVVVGLAFILGVWAYAQSGQRGIETRKKGPSDAGSTAADGPFSYQNGLTAAFEEEVQKVGQISVEDFAKRFTGKTKYLAKISWDPTSAKYWDRFILAPNHPKFIKDGRSIFPEGQQHLFDFRLNEKELAVLKTQGFAVSERLGSHSFTDLYYRIYVRDLPVFVSSDSMMHVWHRFFDRLLEDLEQQSFQPAFREMLQAMSVQIPGAKKEYPAVLAESLNDVDFFLAVAHQLLQTGQPSMLGQNERVEQAVKACLDGKMERYPLFGRPRTIDFSQFKPRGRYDESEQTKNYFRAVMWLGRIDFRIAGGDYAEQDVRELAGAMVLHDLLKRAKKQESWQNLDRALTYLIGKSDSLNFSQLGEVLTGVNAVKVTPADLTDLRTRIQESKIGEQQIRGEWFCVDPEDPRKFVLPRSFAFMGQRFILDSWALSKVVYDDILWKDEAGVQEKIQRRIPSCLDMSFAVLGNDHLAPLLVDRLKNKTGRAYRDGLPYQHNLTAVRNLVDRLPESAWKESLYAQWMGCLRELSKPTTGSEYPESMRTSSWALKATTTQLASWTQLRHDTVLYAKPSYSTGNSCEYPAGFVEPIPHFWARYEDMVLRTKTMLEKMPFSEANKWAKAQHLARLESFVKASKMLRAIAEKEVAHKELAKDEINFLKDTVVLRGECGSPPVNGWYPNLFGKRSDIKSKDDAHKWVALVTDVHTDPPSPPVGDPGCVIHQGVGNVDLLVIAVDNGKDRMVYAGPVFSHFEFETPNAVRRTNGEWHDALRTGKQPPRPEWTRGFVVPGVNPDVKDYGKLDARDRN